MVWTRARKGMNTRYALESVRRLSGQGMPGISAACSCCKEDGRQLEISLAPILPPPNLHDSVHTWSHFPHQAGTTH